MKILKTTSRGRAPPLIKWSGKFVHWGGGLDYTKYGIKLLIIIKSISIALLYMRSSSVILFYRKKDTLEEQLESFHYKLKLV